MKHRTMVMAVLLMTAAAGCSRIKESGWNPLNWGGGTAAPQSLAPKGGYETRTDPRLPIPSLISARWEKLPEGRLLVVTGMGDRKGWWDVALIAQHQRPDGRPAVDSDGVLRLRMVGTPPPADAPAQTAPARPETDSITTAMAFSSATLSQVARIEISAANGGLSLRP